MRLNKTAYDSIFISSFSGFLVMTGYPATMSSSCLILIICVILSLSCSVVSDCDPCYMDQYIRHVDKKFEQKTNRFWEYNEEFKTWVEVDLPYDLVSCINGNCTVVNTIRNLKDKSEDHKEGESDMTKKSEDVKQGEVDLMDQEVNEKKDIDRGGLMESSDAVLPVRKRVSLTRMSETSIWITGQSGTIYERFWNGLHWVIAPHDLQVGAGFASSVFMVNQTILALSESGILYQMKITEDSKPIWVEFMPVLVQMKSNEMHQNSAILLSSGVSSHDKERMYFCTKNGSLLELSEVDPPRWTNYGQPPGANVAALADAATIRPEVFFTISSAGDLYEYDQRTKPPWKKHLQREGSKKDKSLAPQRGCTLKGIVGTHSVSLFLLTKGGELVERRLHQRKWKWMVHGSPKGHSLSSITCISQDEPENTLFLTSATGFIFEYQIPKYPGNSQDTENEENWVNHMHPTEAKAARGIAGLQLQVGRMIFPLDDGRLAELHLSGNGGDNLGPNIQISMRRKSLLKYVWSIWDAPETEGWNAEYCTEEHGPTNCMAGTKDETDEAASARPASRRKKSSKVPQFYLAASRSDAIPANILEDYSHTENLITKNFALRLMNEGNSFFLVTDKGLTFEYLEAESVWFWLRHEHSTAVRGALGNYNGSLFLVDEHGSLLIRERNISDLAWINCTAMRKGRHVIGGPPWDGIPGEAPKARLDDAIFFVSKAGRLLQFTVALRKFKWKDCGSPPTTRVASIVDQEIFRGNIVFVVGRNGKLYQYNKVTGLWHEHRQSKHLVLSRFPGTTTRLSSASLKGSLFMLSEDGGLVEYQWNSLDGWNWVEHGTPYTNVTLVGSPGPCFKGAELFLVGSDGNVYLRYLDQGAWKWRDCGFPYLETTAENNKREVQEKSGEEVCIDKDLASAYKKIEENLHAINQNCDPKVASTRPIPFTDDSVIYELMDGRLAEMRRLGDKNWVWSRTIGTPTSLCMANFWTALAS